MSQILELGSILTPENIATHAIEVLNPGLIPQAFERFDARGAYKKIQQRHTGLWEFSGTAVNYTQPTLEQFGDRDILANIRTAGAGAFRDLNYYALGLLDTDAAKIANFPGGDFVTDRIKEFDGVIDSARDKFPIKIPLDVNFAELITTVADVLGAMDVVQLTAQGLFLEAFLKVIALADPRIPTALWFVGVSYLLAEEAIDNEWRAGNIKEIEPSKDRLQLTPGAQHLESQLQKSQVAWFQDKKPKALDAAVAQASKIIRSTPVPKN